MKSLLKFCILTVVAALWAAPAPAQPKTAEAKSKPAAENKQKEAPWSRKLPEVQFENSSLTDVANYLGDLFPEINFVVHPSVAQTPVSLKLRSVTLDDIFTALEICTKDPVLPQTPPTIDPNTGLPVAFAASPSVQIKKLNERMVSFTAGEASAAATEKPVCRAFSLNRYLAGKNEDDTARSLAEIQDALEICWNMIESVEPRKSTSKSPSLSIHKGTKLLLVVGQATQVEVVAQVISQLNGDPVVIGYPGLPGTASGAPFSDYLIRRPMKAADPSSPFAPGPPVAPGSIPSQSTPPPGK